MKNFDYLIVGTGLFGSVFAYEANKKGKKCLVIDKRDHIGGNIYTENIEGINVHKYGAHIFHTSNKEVWDYINQFGEFNRYTNSPVARYKNELYNLPFNMNTFNKLWGVVTPKQAMEKIEEEKIPIEPIKQEEKTELIEPEKKTESIEQEDKSEDDKKSIAWIAAPIVICVIGIAFGIFLYFDYKKHILFFKKLYIICNSKSIIHFFFPFFELFYILFL